MKKSILFLSIMFMAFSSFAKDIKTLVVTTTPQMHCENCENKIKNNLRFEKGIRNIKTDITTQTVTIVYNADKISESTIIDAFKKFNYNARKLNEGEKVEIIDSEECENM